MCTKNIIRVDGARESLDEMIALICFVFAILASPFSSKIRLEVENTALRHQLIVLRRQVCGRARLTDNDRYSLSSSVDGFRRS